MIFSRSHSFGFRNYFKLRNNLINAPIVILALRGIEANDCKASQQGLGLQLITGFHRPVQLHYTADTQASQHSVGVLGCVVFAQRKYGGYNGDPADFNRVCHL